MYAYSLDPYSNPKFLKSILHFSILMLYSQKPILKAKCSNAFLYPKSLGTVCLYFNMAVVWCSSPAWDVSLAENVERAVLAGLIPELAETLLHKAPGVWFCCIIYWPQRQENWTSSPIQVIMHILVLLGWKTLWAHHNFVLAEQSMKWNRRLG